jgi:hypothetical protein
MVPSFPQWQIRQLLTPNHAPGQILHKCMISFQIPISCLQPLTLSYYGNWPGSNLASVFLFLFLNFTMLLKKAMVYKYI